MKYTVNTSIWQCRKWSLGVRSHTCTSVLVECALAPCTALKKRKKESVHCKHIVCASVNCSWVNVSCALSQRFHWLCCYFFFPLSLSLSHSLSPCSVFGATMAACIVLANWLQRVHLEVELLAKARDSYIEGNILMTTQFGEERRKRRRKNGEDER